MNASAVRRCANAHFGQPWDAAEPAELRSPSGPVSWPPRHAHHARRACGLQHRQTRCVPRVPPAGAAGPAA
jgi:hypothetical protein